ncbi:MAG: hypothetical protein LBV40_03745 [Methanomicrobiales archaeon]|jgi:type III secretory pathway component EscR|nr:hypothetical protein [Methanomicrobiales archaeon]
MARYRRDTYVLMLSVFPSFIIGNALGLQTKPPFMRIFVTCGLIMALYLIIDRIYPKGE